MRGKEERSIILLSLTCSLIGIFLIYFASIHTKPIEMEISDITLEFEGRKVTTSGFIKRVYFNEEKNYVSLTLSDGFSFVQVPLFSDLVNAMKKEGISPNYFREGMKITVTGMVSEYKGRIQIIPRKVDDIRFEE